MDSFQAELLRPSEEFLYFSVCFPKKALLVYNRHRLLVQEAEMHNLTRITIKPEVMGGKPCIQGMRVTVGTIVGLVASGKMVNEVLADYPYLEQEDILDALSYAAWRAEEREVPMDLVPRTITSGVEKSI